jgi:hypothetical protein
VDQQCQSPERCPQCEDSIRHCRRFLVHLEKGTVLPKEFAYNAALSLLQVCAASAYLDSLPDAIDVRFERHLQSSIDSEGYMPFVRPFVVDLGSEQKLSFKRQTIEPKIVRLCRASQARSSRLRASRT